MKFQTCTLLVSVTLFVASGSASGPCCQTCEPGKEKYYSVPNPKEANTECGECCLQPGRYKFWKLFEPKLLKGDCASQGFTKYKSTETDGVPPLAVTNDRYARPNGCPEKWQAVYADMHDGDKKEMTISGPLLTIRPFGNNQTWVINSKLDPTSCSAVVDFNVPGKPSPPPVSLTATFWYSDSIWSSVSIHFLKTEFEFTDPTGKLPAGPLNRWVQLVEGPYNTSNFPCPTSLKAVYADMHDGDMKEITISGASMTIRPSGNNQTWVVKSPVDPKSCSAVIDFNVPGKPGPPPVDLTATLLTTVPASDSKNAITEFEFTDPSGTLAAADFPLNHWVQIKKEKVDKEILI